MVTAILDTSDADLLTAARAGERLRVCVADSGSGIAADELGRIFERHHQGAGKAPADRGGGSHGLGLAIVKRIIHLHRGQVSVASTPGQGTTVTLDWPQRAATASTDKEPTP